MGQSLGALMITCIVYTGINKLPKELGIFFPILDNYYCTSLRYDKVAINRKRRNSQFEGFVEHMEGHSTEDILKAISDSKSLAMFRSIANGSVESEVLKETTGLSKKQYYLRTRQLLKTGLIQRNKGRFLLTCLGAVVYHAHSL